MIQYNPVSSASLLASQIQEFREIFSLVDEDQGGSINAEELMQLTELMNMGATDEEVEQLIEEIDNSGEGEVYFSDFVQSLASIPQVISTHARTHPRKRTRAHAYARAHTLTHTRRTHAPQVMYKREDVLAAFKVLAGPHAPRGLIQVNALEDALMKFGPGMSAAAAQEITSR